MHPVRLMMAMALVSACASAPRRPAIDRALLGPREAACRYSTGRWDWVGAAPEIAETPEGKPFARVVGRPGMAMVVPLHAGAGGALVKLYEGGVEAAGWLPSSTPELHPAHPIRLADFAWTTPYTDLDVRGAGPGRLRIETNPIHGLKLTTPLRGEVACDDLVLHPAKFDAAKAAGVVHPPPSNDMGEPELVDDKPVPLRTSPGGPIVATVSGDAVEDLVLLERRGADERVSMNVGDIFLVGWVPAGSVEQAVLGGVVGGIDFGASGPKTPAGKLVCDQPIPLVVEADGRDFAAGNVRPGAVLELDGDATIGDAFQVSWLSPIAKHARFVVPEYARASCHEVAAKR